MRIACWIPKATNTHSEYVILTAFPLQQWLYERASMVRYTYIPCGVQADPLNTIDITFFVVRKVLRMSFVSPFEICKVLISDNMYGVIL
jgi:hypothetical protein